MIQVSELDWVIKSFNVFVYLERKILDFNYQLEDEFFSSEGVWCGTQFGF